MSDSVDIGGIEYISSKRASEISGYAQDYIGQLSRLSLIDARRIGGLWYVSLDSLNAYKDKKEDFKPQPPIASSVDTDPKSLVFFDGNEYILASYAAKLTGYHQDYIGQLAREGRVLSRQVGNRWYVARKSLFEHKNAKDALLAAVQAESVGIQGHMQSEESKKGPRQPSRDHSLLSYREESGELLPQLMVSEPIESEKNDIIAPISVPIRVFHDHSAASTPPSSHVWPHPVPRRSLFPTIMATSAALTFVIVLSLGLHSFRSDQLVASGDSVATGTGFTASAAAAFEYIGDTLEGVFAGEDLLYRRR